jgi:hypothetical protein
MFGWLLSRFSSPADRGLFRYWDGSKRRAIDPVAAYRQLFNDPDCDLLSDVATAHNPLNEDGSRFYSPQDVIAAEDRLRALTRKIFGVAMWTESQSGLTLDETDELLNGFVGFCEDLKKKRKPLPIASVPTTSTEPCDSSDSDDYPTSTESASCSWPNASSAGVPGGS